MGLVITESGYYVTMMEGGDDGVVGEINLYPGEVRREEGGGDDITHLLVRLSELNQYLGSDDSTLISSLC